MKQRVLVSEKCATCGKVLLLRPLRSESRKRLDNRAFKAHSMGEHTADGLLRVVDVPEPGQPVYCAAHTPHHVST